MAKKRLLMILTGVLLLLILALVLYRCAKGSSTKQLAGGNVMAVPVAVQAVKRENVARMLVASGQLVGEQSVVVSPKISGKVASVNVELGSKVAAGDVLFKLDDTEIQAQVRQQEANVEVMAARKRAADMNRENAARQFERYKQLYEQGAVSEDTFETYKLKLDQADSGEAAANLAQARAGLSYQLSQLANTVITSPISGEVGAKNIEIGSTVTSATQAVTVVNLERVKVQVTVGEQHVGKIKQGQEVAVVVPSVRKEPFTGVVSGVSPAASPSTKGFLVEVKLENPDRVLKQGMFAEVHIAADRKDNVLTVPVDAVVQKAGENVVFTVVEGTAKENRVSTGISNDRVVEVTDGLAEGDQVIVLGQQGLADGARVIVQSPVATSGQAGRPKGE